MIKIAESERRGKPSLARRRGETPTPLQTAIQKANRRLPLPKLLARLGYTLSGTLTMRCPFHVDRNPSFSVFKHNQSGDWLWKCFAGCGCGDAISFLAREQEVNRATALRRYLRLARVTASWKGAEA